MPSKSNGFDASQALRELGRVFGEYRAYNLRSTPVLLQRLGEDLQTSLYRAAADLRPSQQAKIDALPQNLNYHVKRRLKSKIGSEQTALATFRRGPRKGQFRSQSVASQAIRTSGGGTHVSVANEIRLRKRFAAFFQASGWLTDRVRAIGKVIRMIPQAVVAEQLEGADLRVTITNPRPNSAEFGDSTGYVARAFADRAQKMRNYIQRKIDGDAAEFSRPHPDFAGKNVAESVGRAMGGRLAA